MPTGHCYLMMDDLQQAYAAYQSALVNLRNPKVSRRLSPVANSDNLGLIKSHRSRNSGMALEFCTTDTAPSTTPRKPFPRSCRCSPISRRPTKYTSGSASYTSNSRSITRASRYVYRHFSSRLAFFLREQLRLTLPSHSASSIS